MTRPSRQPVAERRAPQRTPPMRPDEARLWASLDRGHPPCPWCGSPAQRVVSVGGRFALSCWDDHA